MRDFEDYAIEDEYSSKLKTVVSLVENPFQFNSNAFVVIVEYMALYDEKELYSDIDFTLYVPKGTKNLYIAAGWGTVNGHERTIIELQDGDVTGDGSVNAEDVEALAKIVMAQEPTAAAAANPNADVNGDGKVNVADIVELVNIIKSKTTGKDLPIDIDDDLGPAVEPYDPDF